jgi:hypothetical protein
MEPISSRVYPKLYFVSWTWGVDFWFEFKTNTHYKVSINYLIPCLIGTRHPLYPKWITIIFALLIHFLYVVQHLIFGVGLPNVEGQLLQDYKTFFILPILLPLNSLNPSWDGSQWCNIKNLENPKITDVIELSVKSPSLCPLFGRAFTPYPLFQWYPQSKEILLNLSIKYWKIAFNAQGSRVIIVVVQVGVAKIYVAAVWRRSGKRQYRIKLILPPKLLEN